MSVLPRVPAVLPVRDQAAAVALVQVPGLGLVQGTIRSPHSRACVPNVAAAPAQVAAAVVTAHAPVPAQVAAAAVAAVPSQARSRVAEPVLSLP